MADSPAEIKQTTSTNTSPQAGQEKVLIPTKYIYLGILGVVLLVVVLVALIVLAVRNPSHTETLRDIAIIALAAESGLIGLALLILIVQVARLTNMLEFEIKPILKNTSDTVSTVRGTATFMSEHVVSPMIKASGYASGFARLAGAVRGLFGQSSSEPRPSEQQTFPEEKNER